MKLAEIDPFLRFAGTVQYKMTGNPVRVTDARLFFVTGGGATLRTEEGSRELKENTLVYCPAGAAYDLSAPEGIDMLVLNFDLSRAHSDAAKPISPHSKDVPSFPVFRTKIDDSPLLNRIFTLTDAANEYSPMLEITREFHSSAPLSTEIAASLLKTLLLKIHRASCPAHDAVKIVKDYVRSHYMQPVTNAEMARLAGYHEYYLNRVFKKETGKSIHQFLLDVRLNAIREKIRNSDLSLSEIAEETGFRSYPHMSGFFKERYGMTPREYRKAFKNKV